MTIVSSNETMMTLKTMISSREMITITTIAGNHDTMVTISRMTSFKNSGYTMCHVSVLSFLDILLESDRLFVSDSDMLCPYVWLKRQTLDLQVSRVFFCNFYPIGNNNSDNY